jgi:hypothetical protein
MARHGDDNGDSAIRELLLLEAMKKSRTARQVIINELRKLSARTQETEDSALLLAAADLLEK